jgi:hypothetical protein
MLGIINRMQCLHAEAMADGLKLNEWHISPAERTNLLLQIDGWEASGHLPRALETLFGLPIMVEWNAVGITLR